MGLVIASLQAIGMQPADVVGYGIRNRSIAALLPAIVQSGFDPATSLALVGDLMMVRPGPGQHHLIISGGRDGFVHAHAGLCKIIHSPGPLPWPVEGHFRLRSAIQE